MQWFSLLGAVISAAAVAAAYRLGYASGFRSGKDSGYEDGKREGAKEGSVRGYAIGFDRGKRARHGQGEKSRETEPGPWRWHPTSLLIVAVVLIVLLWGTQARKAKGVRSESPRPVSQTRDTDPSNSSIQRPGQFHDPNFK